MKRAPAGGDARCRRFSKVLVANRGECAVRIIRALDELGIDSVAIHSDADADSVHARRATRSVEIGPASASASYMSIERILKAARDSGVDAIHPGYGFLSENAELARACEGAGFTFIGPPPDLIHLMGSKVRARATMRAAGIPVVPGGLAPVATLAEATAAAEEVGYPIVVKAVAGGGGRGLRVAGSEQELPDAFVGAAREGERLFGDSTVYLERYFPDPRHIEVQIVADTHGNVVELGVRDCSVQRRHQKVIEETPAVSLSADLERQVREVGVAAARAVRYVSVGTVEGLVDQGHFYFLEMNTRLQVEHGVTEMATGVDLVREQLAIACGEPLSVGQDDIVVTGHAIECRINAENAGRRFTPSPGMVTGYREPGGPFVRVDSGVEAGAAVSPHYDPLLAKVIVWDRDRATATRRMLRALGEFEIGGVNTLIPFHRALLSSRQWHDAQTCRDLLADQAWLRAAADFGVDRACAAPPTSHLPT